MAIDYTKKQDPELRQLAKSRRIDVTGKTRADIIRALQKHDSGGSSPADPKTPTPVTLKKKVVAKPAPPPEEDLVEEEEEETPAPPPRKVSSAKKPAPPPTEEVGEDSEEELPEEEPQAEEPAKKRGRPPKNAATQASAKNTDTRLSDIEDRLARLEAWVGKNQASSPPPSADEEVEISSAEDLEKLSFAELKTLCEDNGIPVPKGSTAETLKSAILDAMDAGGQEETASNVLNPSAIIEGAEARYLDREDGQTYDVEIVAVNSKAKTCTIRTTTTDEQYEYDNVGFECILEKPAEPNPPKKRS